MGAAPVNGLAAAAIAASFDERARGTRVAPRAELRFAPSQPTPTTVLVDGKPTNLKPEEHGTLLRPWWMPPWRITR